jgi:hypothetical protein
MKNIKLNYIALIGGLLFIAGVFLTVIIEPYERGEDIPASYVKYSFFDKWQIEFDKWRTEDINESDLQDLADVLDIDPESISIPKSETNRFSAYFFCFLFIGILCVVFAIRNISIVNKCIGGIAFLILCFTLLDLYFSNYEFGDYKLGYGWIILFLGAILNIFDDVMEW